MPVVANVLLVSVATRPIALERLKLALYQRDRAYFEYVATRPIALERLKLLITGGKAAFELRLERHPSRLSD